MGDAKHPNPTALYLEEGYLQIQLPGATLFVKVKTDYEGNRSCRVSILLEGGQKTPGFEIKRGLEATYPGGQDLHILIPENQPEEG